MIPDRAPNRPERRLLASLAVVAVIVAGCGQAEVLEPLRGARPADVDFSGRWRMEDDFEAMEERIDRAIAETDGIDERDILRSMISTDSNARTRRSRPSRGSVGGLVHVFLESGQNLRITQTDLGLFIAFDRSVVEEYRFGEARMVATGGARAQRVSGWQDRSYVIETLGEEGMKLIERYELVAGGDRLTREITLRSAEGDRVSITQSFARLE